MTNSIDLVPLACTKCGRPVPANPGEIAWVCEQCGQGLLLADSSLTPITAKFGGAAAPGAPGRPYWVAEGRVTMQSREAFEQVGLLGMGNQSSPAHQLWDAPRTFYIPAYACTPEELIETGTRLLLNPPPAQSGAAMPFQPVLLAPADVQPLAEAIVMNIEFDRKDHLKEFLFLLQLESPTLLILPA